MTTLAITNTLVAGSTAVAADVNTNFADVVAVVNGNLDNSNIAASAGIDVLKLNAPYAVHKIAWTSNGLAATTVPVSAADPVGRVYKHTLALPRGRPHALCAIDLWAQAISLGGQTITVTVTVGSQTVGGTGRTIDAANTHYTIPSTLGTVDVFTAASPPAMCSDGDEMVIIVAANGGTPTVTGLCVTVVFKAMHTA